MFFHPERRFSSAGNNDFAAGRSANAPQVESTSLLRAGDNIDDVSTSETAEDLHGHRSACPDANSSLHSSERVMRVSQRCYAVLLLALASASMGYGQAHRITTVYDLGL